MALTLPKKNLLAGGALPNEILDWTHRLDFTDTGNSEPYTVSSIPLGSAPGAGERRFLVCAAATNDSGGGACFTMPADCQFDGANPDFYQEVNASTSNASGVVIAAKEYTTGTTAQVVLQSTDKSVLGMIATFWTITTRDGGLQFRSVGGNAADKTDPICTINALTGLPIIAVVSYTNGGPFVWRYNGAIVGTEHQDVDIQTTEYCSIWSHTATVDDATTEIMADDSNTGESSATLAACFQATPD